MSMDQVVDLRGVSPQRTFLESHPKKPESTSTLYLKRWRSENAAGGYDHTVVGVHIVLAEGNSNGLWSAFHIDRAKQKNISADQKRDDAKFLMATRSLTICCDTLEIHGEFSVPEADVTIYARCLSWATPDAAINTSPLDWDVPKAPNAQGTTPGEDGANGRDAGSLNVFVSIVKSVDGTSPRLLALGGKGQDPGDGLPGTDGVDKWSCVESEFDYADATAMREGKLRVEFTPPAVYVDAEFWDPTGKLLNIYNRPLGSPSFPTSGTNATAAGTPGNGGNGGKFITNSAEAGAIKNDAGASGAKAADQPGGRAGRPGKSAMYKLVIYQPLTPTNDPRKDLTQTSAFSTKPGSGAPAKAAARETGSTPRAVVISCDNAWLHPYGVQTVLEYARDAYLGGDRDTVLQFLEGYEGGLTQPAPTSTLEWRSPWEAASPAQWTAAQTEVASMLQRLRARLDYFGNSAGYTPLLSLPGSINLYKGETSRTLRTLLLADLVQDETRKAEDAASMFGNLIESALADSARAADQVEGATKAINDGNKTLDTIEAELHTKQDKLLTLQTQLLARAETTEQNKAFIKFSIKMAGAICQVIPYGQPALGAAGSLANVASDLIGKDTDAVPDTVSRMSDIIKKYREAAKKAADAAKKADKPKGDAAKDPKAAQNTASSMSTALDGLGPAITQASGAIAALQVPQSEVDAELARLESQCPELKSLVREIADFNSYKADVLTNLAAAFESLADGYSRLSSNAAAIVSMWEQKNTQLGRVDGEASLFVDQMSQRSRLTLQKYLYLMVKAYETTTLRPLDDVDWELIKVTEKIAELLKEVKTFDQATLDDKANTLDVLFQDNLNIVRNKLLEETAGLSEVTALRRFILASSQSPDLIDALNNNGRVVIDPFEYALVDAGTQLARLSDVDLEAVEFDADGTALPEGTDLIVDLVPARFGTLRRNELLCAVYSEAPVSWNWVYSAGTAQKSQPSAGSQDILNFILGNGSDQVRQKISRPPLWSELAIQIRYRPPLRDQKPPRITKLSFKLHTDVSNPDAGTDLHVLEVHPVGSCPSDVVVCTADLAGRGAGIGHFMRVFSAKTQVSLTTKETVGASRLDRWQLIGAGDHQANADAPVFRMDRDVIAFGYWSEQQVSSFVLQSAHIPVPAGVQTDEVAQTMVKRFKAPVSVRSTSPAQDIALIRLDARDDAPVIGFVPPEGDPDVLQEGPDGWREVNFRGVAGWVRR